jgi:sortase A
MVLGAFISTWAIVDSRLATPPQDPVSSLEATLGGGERAAGGNTVPPAPESEAPAILYPVTPDKGEKIGTISLPTLGLTWPVYEGTTEDELSLGVGHYTGSVLPGIRDNSVLSGHRNTVFGRLGELEVGDQIIVSTGAGDFTYEVCAFRVVERTSRDVIVPTPTAVLTLTTCHPFDSVFPTTDAFIVSADLVESVFRPQ